MMTVDEYQCKRKKELADGLSHTGVRCPRCMVKCREETEMIQNSTITLMNPPTKVIECPVCKWKEVVLV